MFPGLAKNADLVPVWVCAGDFCALGLLPPGAQCDETIHVLLPLPYSLILELWHMGRGRARSGEPLVAFDGRLILAAEGIFSARPLLATANRFKWPLLLGVAKLGANHFSYTEPKLQPILDNIRQQNSNVGHPSFKASSNLLFRTSAEDLQTAAHLYSNSTSTYAVDAGRYAYVLGSALLGMYIPATPLLLLASSSAAVLKAVLEFGFDPANTCTMTYLTNLRRGEVDSLGCQITLQYGRQGMHQFYTNLQNSAGSDREKWSAAGPFYYLRKTAEKQIRACNTWWRRKSTGKYSLEEVVYGLEQTDLNVINYMKVWIDNNSDLLQDLMKNIVLMRKSKQAVIFGSNGYNALWKGGQLHTDYDRLKVMEVDKYFDVYTLFLWDSDSLSNWLGYAAVISFIIQFCRWACENGYRHGIHEYASKLNIEIQNAKNKYSLQLKENITENVVAIEREGPGHLRLDALNALCNRAASVYAAGIILDIWKEVNTGIQNDRFDIRIETMEPTISTSRVFDSLGIEPDMQRRIFELTDLITNDKIRAILKGHVNEEHKILQQVSEQMQRCINNTSRAALMQQVETLILEAVHLYSIKLMKCVLGEPNSPVDTTEFNAHKQVIFNKLRGFHRQG